MFIRAGLFYLLAFFFTILIGGAMQAVGLSVEVGAPQFGPGLAALVMLLIFRKDGAKLNLSFKQIGGKSVAGVLLFPLGAAAVIFAIVSLVMGAQEFPPAVGAFVLLWTPFGAFGEELGWRGYLHKMFEGRVPAWVSSLVVGVLWALWHMQLYQNGVVFMLFFVLLIVSYTVVLYYFMRQTAFNVWVAALFHLMINLTNLLYFSVIQETAFMVISALVWAVVAGVFFVRHWSLYMERKAEHPPAA